MKCGIFAIKELADFLKERAKLEEDNSKAHAKLSKQVWLPLPFLYKNRISEQNYKCQCFK